MTLETTTISDTCVVTVPERFDTNTAPDVESELRQILKNTGQNKVIFDFSRTGYIASAGLKVLLQVTRDMMKSGGRVVLVEVGPPVYKVFDMAGFTSIFTICKSREDALQKMT
ncbi:STAS domain-containing protein [Methanoregula sp.]|uniref:STAS domain-containing protein n=1 Tax=Methanoregula sp. TaxID=2052170 RepID=UPI00236BA13F|nr:STAS domain-containing protein [Methanoregula sp.]MDD1685845.1 STAS domain-containing protein [Methanoregula sp.]